MPAGKLYKFKARRRRKTKPTTSFAAKVKKVLNSAKETKYIDQADAGTAALYSATTDILHLTPIPEGDSYNNRDGQEVMLRTLVADLKLTRDPASAVPNQTARVTFFTWNVGGVPGAGDLYDGGNISRPVKAAFFLEKKGFVLRDLRYALSVDGPNQVIKDYTLKINRKAKFSGPAAGDDIKGNIYVAIGFATADANTQWTFGSRCYFKEM